MPFGLCNAPATFQHLVIDIFREFLDHFVVVYLYGILIFSATLELHRSHVKKVLGTLKRHGLYAKAEKFEFQEGINPVSRPHYLYQGDRYGPPKGQSYCGLARTSG